MLRHAQYVCEACELEGGPQPFRARLVRKPGHERRWYGHSVTILVHPLAPVEKGLPPRRTVGNSIRIVVGSQDGLLLRPQGVRCQCPCPAAQHCEIRSLSCGLQGTSRRTHRRFQMSRISRTSIARSWLPPPRELPPPRAACCRLGPTMKLLTSYKLDPRATESAPDAV